MEINLEMFAKAQEDGSMELQARVEVGKLVLLTVHVCKPMLKWAFKLSVSNGILF